MVACIVLPRRVVACPIPRIGRYYLLSKAYEDLPERRKAMSYPRCVGCYSVGPAVKPRKDL
jgi:hypothetical protein